jgi:hypothetical protein
VSFNVNGVDTRGTSRVAMVGDSGRVAVSVDGGSTWKTWTAPYAVSLYDVAFRDDTHLVAVGRAEAIVRMTLAADGTISGTAAKSVNGSLTAPAPKKPTALSLSAPSTSSYGSAKLYGWLKYGSGTALPYKYVAVEQYAGAGKWNKIATVKTSASGYWTYTAKPVVKTTYRARYLGDTVYAASTSASRSVLPRVRLSRTSSWSTLAYNKTYYATGYIEPRHYAADAKVRIYAYRKASDGKYYYKASYAAAYGSSYKTTLGYKTAYKAAVKLPYKGTWRVRAYHAADTKNAATWGSYDYLTVK